MTWWPSWRRRDQIRFFRLTQRSSRGLARVGARCQGWRAGTLLCLPQLSGWVPVATATLMRLPRGFPTSPVPDSPAPRTPEPQEDSGPKLAAKTGWQPRDKHAPDSDTANIGTWSLTSRPRSPRRPQCARHTLQKTLAYPSPSRLSSPWLQIHPVPLYFPTGPPRLTLVPSIVLECLRSEPFPSCL